MSLVNDSLKFTSTDTQICWFFFSAKIIRILYLESAKTVNEMTLNELVKLTMLWTTGPWILDHRLLFLALPRRTLRYPISPALLDEKVKKLTTYWINTSQVIRQLNDILKTWLYCWISRNNAQLLTLVIPKGDKVNEMVYPIFWGKLQRKKIFRYYCFRYEKNDQSSVTFMHMSILYSYFAESFKSLSWKP